MAMVGHLENITPIFAQMSNRITNIEFTAVSPTIVNTMLAGRYTSRSLGLSIVYVACSE